MSEAKELVPREATNEALAKAAMLLRCEARMCKYFEAIDAV
jgi:hypothetical protein